MRENIIETRLRIETVKRGGRCLKFVSPGNAGVPDRWVILPNIPPFLVETKATGKKPSPLQEWWHRWFKSMGIRVFVPDSIENVLNIFNDI